MIVIFNGPPRTGKDECCAYLIEKGFEHLSFKKVLFQETCKYFGVDINWFMDGYNDRSVKETSSSYLQGYSRRESMIHVSENVIKPKYGKDFFGNEVANTIVEGKDYCFSDGGFKEELVPIINKVGTKDLCLVQLTREGCDFSSDSRRYLNGTLINEYIIEKETPIIKSHILPENFSVRTYRIHNNGNVKELHGTIEKICRTEKEYTGKQT